MRSERRYRSRAEFFACLVIPLAVMLFSAVTAAQQGATEKQKGKQAVVVYQPSHQGDDRRGFIEADVCGNIVDAAVAASTGAVKVHKVWSYNVDGLHHARVGTNTLIADTAEIDALGRISGYAYEINESNKLNPDLFVAVHNNGGTRRNACWGYVHEGDPNEQRNRDLAKIFVEEICQVVGMENGGVLGDSSPKRNDYRCKNTGKLCFYSLDENVNSCPLRVLLEIGDGRASFELLTNPDNQKRIGQAIQKVVERIYSQPRF